MSRLLGAVGVLVLAGTVATTPVKAAFIGGLDGVSLSSTFEKGGVTAEPLPYAGWETILGSAVVFDQHGNNGSLVGAFPYDNYGVQFDTFVPITVDTKYTLAIDIGFVAEIPGGSASYSLNLGTLSGGVFSGLANASGSVVRLGNLYSFVVSKSEQIVIYTGSTVAPGTLAVQWFQTANPGPTDFLAIDNVTLDATAIPLPPALALFTTGLAMLGFAGWRRRRAA